MKLKAKDFRIGNWIIDYETEPEVIIYYQVEEIKKLSKSSLNQNLGVSYRDGSCWCTEPIPIPLTEEILLKCGFEKSKIDVDNGWLNLKYRFLDFASDESVNYNKVFLTINRMDIVCDYLHELQNLYKYLTKTELKIDLTK